MYEPSTNEEIKLFLEDWSECRRISGNAFVDYIKRKRALNTAWAVTICLKPIEFESILSAMYFKCSSEMKPILNFYEDRLIECKLENDKFRKTLHDKFLGFREKVKEKHQECLLVEFSNLLTQAGITKSFDDRTINRVFSAYCSLVQQSMTYFIDDLNEYAYGVKPDGTFLTVEDRWKMLDWAQEGLIERTYQCVLNDHARYNEAEILHELAQRFGKYGMKVNDIDDVSRICSIANNFGNVLSSMMYYMSEQTKDMIPVHDVGFDGYQLPKKWLDTEYYKERLLKRNCALPGCIKATCRYFGDVKEVYFREVIKDEAVVMLYRVVADIGNGEYTDYSGYYIPSRKFFYVYYAIAENAKRLVEPAENFILELYFLLTVKRTEEEKQLKQYTRPLIAEEYDDVEKEPRWNNQPIISFSIHSEEEEKKPEKKRRAYRQGMYEYDNASIGCFVRRLPAGQTVSWEARSNAEKYGYELEPGYTFVTPFERKQRHIKLLANK